MTKTNRSTKKKEDDNKKQLSTNLRHKTKS